MRNGIFLTFEDTTIYQTIFGMNRITFFIVIIVIMIILLGLFYLYLSIVFVDNNTVKIIERNGKFRKIISSGFSFIVPVLDKVVCTISTLNLTLHSATPIFLKEKEQVSINYSLIYIVTDYEKFYYSSKNIDDYLETIFTKQIIIYFDKNKKTPFPIDESREKEILTFLEPCSNKIGIKISDIFFLQSKDK